MTSTNKTFSRLASLSSLLALVAMPILPACGGGDGGDLTLAEATVQVHEHFCDWSVRCGLEADKASCLANNNDDGQTEADVMSDKVMFHADQAQACFDEIDALGCSITALQGAGTLCGTVFMGNVADGAACFQDQECANGTCDTSDCATGAMCCAGKCGSKVAVGGDCKDNGLDCVDTAFCKAGKCTALIAAGAACAQGDQCAGGLVCTGTCASFPKEGETCNTQLPFCDLFFADWCSPTSMKCEKRLAIGAVCTEATQMAPFADGCAVFARCIEGKCKALPGTGEDCLPTPGVVCASNHTSTAGKCVKDAPDMVCGAM